MWTIPTIDEAKHRCYAHRYTCGLSCILTLMSLYVWNNRKGLGSMYEGAIGVRADVNSDEVKG